MEFYRYIIKKGNLLFHYLNSLIECCVLNKKAIFLVYVLFRLLNYSVNSFFIILKFLFINNAYILFWNSVILDVI